MTEKDTELANDWMAAYRSRSKSARRSTSWIENGRTAAMFVALSRFVIANGMEEDVRQAFEHRPHRVDEVSGFVRMDVLSPTEASNEFWLMTYWTDEQSYRTWHRGHRYKDSHTEIPKGLKLVRGCTQIRHFHHIAS